MPDANTRVRAADLQDWLSELRELKDKALSRRDAVRVAELQAEIEELTALLDEVLEAAVRA
jgi:hypothetical protein